MTVSLLEIFAAARAHAAPLAAESAGYLLLAVADHVVSAPRVVEPDDVELSADGSVTLRARRGAVAHLAGAEQAVRRLLARSLEVSSSVGPGLRRAADRAEDAGLATLVRELEVALIPVNRSAARRALSRLHRETERARAAGKLDVSSPVAPVVSAPVVSAAVVSAPVVSAPVVSAPVVDVAPPWSDLSEPSPVALPAVALTPPKKQAAAPAVQLTLTPEPALAVGEPAFTKPEPVVLRAKARGSSTPSLGTVVTAQTLPGEETDRTERAPDVALDADPLDLTIDVVLEESEPEALQPLVDPEPSMMPDVLTAMVELHAGVDADDAPTRLRDVVTEPRPPVEPVSAEPEVASLTAEPEPVEDEWLTPSSLKGALDTEASVPVSFVSERVAPELHDAPTWDPGPVICIVQDPPAPTLLLSEPPPEPSPYAPAVLPVCRRDVSELLDSFHVSAVEEERELRSALKEMAGLELTPMPRRYVDER